MPSPSEQAGQVQRLVQAEDAARSTATAQLLALVAASVAGFKGWYDSAAITEWAAGLARMVEVLQTSLARQTDAYLAQTSTLVRGRRVRPVGAVDVATLRRGITHAGAYGRAADVYRYQAHLLAQPDAPALVSPQEAAAGRAAAVAEMDGQLAVRGQSQAFMAAQRHLTGYRRVIHPELSKGGTCGLCVAASTRLYGPRELMPIHANCNCLPMPVYDHVDVADELNTADLGALYDLAGGSTSAAALKRVRYKTVDHGELGPILVPAGVPVRTARQAKAAATH